MRTAGEFVRRQISRAIGNTGTSFYDSIGDAAYKQAGPIRIRVFDTVFGLCDPLFEYLRKNI